MKTATTQLFLLAVSLAPFSGHAQEPGAVGRRPNIVFILGDDLGPDSLGCYGSKFYKGSTPCIDALAARGVRFTRCYATALCSPTRRQYATGQYPFRNGCLDIDGSGGGRRNDGHPMLTQLLRDAGYMTGKCGKADICPSEPDERLHVWGYWGKEEAFAKRGDRAWQLTGPSELSHADFEYGQEALKEFALDFIKRNAPRKENDYRPFYFLFGFNLPHVPIKRTPLTEPGTTSSFELYKDNIEYIDHVVGAIVDKLKETGQLNNTLIMVSGDNGSLNKVNQERVKSPIWDPRFETYREIDGGKGDRKQNREGTALVPLVVHWPDGVAPELSGKTLGELVDFTDFLPTFAELAEARIPPGWVLDGHSFAKLLRGQPGYTPRDWVYHQIENNWCLRGPRYRLNRDGRFFDMSDAPFAMKEIKDLTPQQEAIKAEYQAILHRFDPANGFTYEGHQDNEWDNPAWEWKRKHFGGAAFDTPTAGDRSDPDGDGVENIFERAFGWDPNSKTDRMPEPVTNDSTTTMTVPQIKNNDVRIEAFGSEDGRSWSPLKPSGRGPFIFQGQSSGGGPLRIRLEAHRITPWNEPRYTGEVEYEELQ